MPEKGNQQVKTTNSTETQLHQKAFSPFSNKNVC